MPNPSRLASCLDEAYAFYQSGASITQVGAAYGLSFESVRQQFLRHGLALRTKREAQALPHVKEANRAKHIGRRSAPATEFKPGLIPANRSPVSTDLIVELYRSGLGANAISERVGLSKPQVLRRLRKAGVERRTMAEGTRLRGARCRGEKSANWKGGKTSLQTTLRNSAEYDQWRRAVMERDDFTCRITGQRGGRLHVHHVGTPCSFLLQRAVESLGLTKAAPEHYPAIVKAVMDMHTIDMGVTLSREAHRDLHAGRVSLPPPA